MKTKNWVYLFWTTLVIGASSGAITGIVLEWDKYAANLQKGAIGEFIVVIIWLFGMSAIFSLISEMGFFAYLSVHRIGLGLFRSLWSPVQIILIALTLFDLIYFRYQAFAKSTSSIMPYIMVAAFLLLYSLVVAYIKQKETNRYAFVPALFFMIVVTVLEWFPALYINDQEWLWLYFVPLLTSNTWQLLILHRLIEPKK